MLFIASAFFSSATALFSIALAFLSSASALFSWATAILFCCSPISFISDFNKLTPSLLIRISPFSEGFNKVSMRLLWLGSEISESGSA